MEQNGLNNYLIEFRLSMNHEFKLIFILFSDGSCTSGSGQSGDHFAQYSRTVCTIFAEGLNEENFYEIV